MVSFSPSSEKRFHVADAFSLRSVRAVGMLDPIDIPVVELVIVRCMALSHSG